MIVTSKNIDRVIKKCKEKLEITKVPDTMMFWAYCDVCGIVHIFNSQTDKDCIDSYRLKIKDFL
jgi:hypothetical protein